MKRLPNTSAHRLDAECLEKRREKVPFEESNYIIEPRQMVKYFFSMLML